MRWKMLKIKDNVDLKELEKFGFKYSARNKLLYKTTIYKLECKIYIDLLPCHNNNNELKIECETHFVPNKVLDKLYDLIQAGIVEKVSG